MRMMHPNEEQFKGRITAKDQFFLFIIHADRVFRVFIYPSLELIPIIRSSSIEVDLFIFLTRKSALY